MADPNLDLEIEEEATPPLGIKVSEEDFEWEEPDDIDFSAAEQGGWEDDFDDDDWDDSYYVYEEVGDEELDK
jgi:hypothetical protein